MKISRRTLPLLLVPSTALLLVMSAFTFRDEDDYYFKVNKGLELFGEVYHEVAEAYVDEIDPETFITAGIDGMLKTLDPYTVYLKKRDAADIDLLTTGSYAGIGITVGLRDSLITIVDVVDSYSAQRQGVRIGDKILSINGVELLHGPVEALREYTRGEPNTTIDMVVLRDGMDHPLAFTLTRESIRVRSVSYSGIVGDRIGYVKLTRFGASAGEELENAIHEFQRQGGIKGIILDLRDNPGGLLESAVDVSSKFLPSGSIVVTTHGRDTTEDRVYRSTEDPVAAGLPLVVLVNGNSASASEIVAGAIQDLDAGVILGSQSFGKGLVQTLRRLPYESSLKITTARYYTPSGRSIQKVDYALGRLATSEAKRDTLNRLFRTLHGRPVGEHGGVLPDTTVEYSSSSGVLKQLREDLIFFKFATRYAAARETVPADFTVDNAILKQFEEYALQQIDSSRNSSVLARGKELLISARSEGYSPETIRRIESLQSELRLEYRRELFRYRKDIQQALYDEIVSRFRLQSERLTASLGGDQQIQAAIGLLHSGRWAYGRLLSSR